MLWDTLVVAIDVWGGWILVVFGFGGCGFCLRLLCFGGWLVLSFFVDLLRRGSCAGVVLVGNLSLRWARV